MSDAFVIKYGTTRHAKLVDALKARKRLSMRELSKQRTAWDAAENKVLAYLPEQMNDTLRRQKKEKGKPQYVTIDIPYSYAMMLSAHTYWTSVFLGRAPVFQFSSRFGNTEQQQQAVEAVLDYQVNVGEALLPLYIWLYDAGKYGLGVVGHYWTEETETISQIEEVPQTFLGVEIKGAKPKKKRTTQKVKGYVGNKVYNVRPMDWYPDPRVSIANFQKGEFCGRDSRVGWNTILRGQESGRYFNVNELHARAKSRVDSNASSSQLVTPDTQGDVLITIDEKDVGFVEILEMTIELSPADWQLGTSTTPEKWVFELANSEVIIAARPLGYYHNRFPFEVLEYEIEGYALSKRSMLDVVAPLNDTLNWLINAHFFNVRKAMNDQIVYDPSRISTRDLLDPGEGRLIRLLPEAYGTDIKAGIMQLQMQDITRNHITDTSVITDLMQRVTGAVDNIMGMVNQGGRKTATEVRASSTFGINRLKTVTEYMSAMGFQPLATKLLQNTQQFYSEEWLLRVAGDNLAYGNPFVNVTPDSIQGSFDFVPVDGSMPVDRYAQANLWKEMLGTISRVPQVAMQYDLGGIFAWIARLSGLRSVDQFKINVVPDQVAEVAAQAGNSIPVGGGNGRGNTSAANAGGSPQVANAPRVSGVGPAA